MTATDWVMGYFVGLSSDGVIIGKQGYSYCGVAHAAGDFRPNTAYTLRVECEGATLRVFVDGKLYLEYTDPEPFMQGMVGVRTHNGIAAQKLCTVTVQPAPVALILPATHALGVGEEALPIPAKIRYSDGSGSSLV